MRRPTNTPANLRMDRITTSSVSPTRRRRYRRFYDAGDPDGFPVPDLPAVACKDEASDASAADSPDGAEEGDVSPPGDAGDAGEEDQQGDAGDGVACELPPSVCASPDWLVYFVNPTCVAGLCRWEKSYYQCRGSPCVDGACQLHVTASK